jgi:hypothetical protein
MAGAPDDFSAFSGLLVVQHRMLTTVPTLGASMQARVPRAARSASNVALCVVPAGAERARPPHWGVCRAGGCAGGLRTARGAGPVRCKGVLQRMRRASLGARHLILYVPHAFAHASWPTPEGPHRRSAVAALEAERSERAALVEQLEAAKWGARQAERRAEDQHAACCAAQQASAAAGEGSGAHVSKAQVLSFGPASGLGQGLHAHCPMPNRPTGTRFTD